MLVDQLILQVNYSFKSCLYASTGHRQLQLPSKLKLVIAGLSQRVALNCSV